LRSEKRGPGKKEATCRKISLLLVMRALHLLLISFFTPRNHRYISYIDAEKIQRKKGKKQQDQYEFSMKKKHNYYYQIQSQLHYSNREKCIFAVYTLIEPCILAIEVKRDESFYAQMEPKLVKFFMGCMLPEIVSPMYPRQKEKKDIREPQYILDAMNELSLRRR
jgi:hypothetical protein